MKAFSAIISILILFTACENDPPPDSKHCINLAQGSNSLAQPYETENVVIVIMDGARYTESWGEPNKQYLPRLAQEMFPEGVVLANFYNNGMTKTNPGHIAMTTGCYEDISNSGSEDPSNPSIFNMYLEKSGNAPEKAWVIASKSKLSVLGKTTDPSISPSFEPRTNCGVGGAGVGVAYRDDSATYDTVFEIFNTYEPNLVMINFREPDWSGHANDWPGYLDGIRMIDEFSYQIWDYLNTHPKYKDKTTFILTNDHGRHSPGVSSGFVSHGDGCEGCRHIFLYASGPDFKKGVEITAPYDLNDLAPTVAELLGFRKKSHESIVIWDLFE